MSALALSSLLGASLATAPALPPAAAPATVERPAAAAVVARRHVVGLQLDAGVPDGVGLSLAWRPLSFLRVGAGALTNGASVGARAGLTLSAPWRVAPALTLEAGHLFEGDANRVVRLVTRDPAFDHALLRRVAYDFATAHLGLELQGTRFGFSLRGGASYLRLPLQGAEALTPADGTVQVRLTDPTLRAVLPSVKLGFAVYFG